MFFFPPPYQQTTFLDDDDNNVPTWPPVGTASLKITEDCDAIFFSATWSFRARVNGTVMYESTAADHPRSRKELENWARLYITQNYTKLRQLGVDADKEYVETWGGSKNDL